MLGVVNLLITPPGRHAGCCKPPYYTPREACWVVYISLYALPVPWWVSLPVYMLPCTPCGIASLCMVGIVHPGVCTTVGVLRASWWVYYGNHGRYTTGTMVGIVLPAILPGYSGGYSPPCYTTRVPWWVYTIPPMVHTTPPWVHRAYIRLSISTTANGGCRR